MYIHEFVCGCVCLAYMKVWALKRISKRHAFWSAKVVAIVPYSFSVDSPASLSLFLAGSCALSLRLVQSRVLADPGPERFNTVDEQTWSVRGEKERDRDRPSVPRERVDCPTQKTFQRGNTHRARHKLLGLLSDLTNEKRWFAFFHFVPKLLYSELN